MIHLKKEYPTETEVVKCTKNVTMTVNNSGIQLDEVDVLNEEWYREREYVDATREEFDEVLKKVVNEINQITKE